MPQHQNTRHHRLPRFFNGKGKENISFVPANMHRAFHLLFAWAYPVIMVAQILNARWLTHSEVLVPIPTERLLEALELLKSVGIDITEEELGVTDEHRKRYRR